MGLSLIITGAGGFLGRAVAKAAVARGHEVRALTRAEADLAAGIWRARWRGPIA